MKVQKLLTALVSFSKDISISIASLSFPSFKTNKTSKAHLAHWASNWKCTMWSIMHFSDKWL